MQFELFAVTPAHSTDITVAGLKEPVAWSTQRLGEPLGACGDKTTFAVSVKPPQSLVPS